MSAVRVMQTCFWTSLLPGSFRCFAFGLSFVPINSPLQDLTSLQFLLPAANPLAPRSWPVAERENRPSAESAIFLNSKEKIVIQNYQQSTCMLKNTCSKEWDSIGVCLHGMWMHIHASYWKIGHVIQIQSQPPIFCVRGLCVAVRVSIGITFVSS